MVQDNLTTFRIKELSVDPSGVVNLNLDVGEMAVDMVGQLASAAAAAYGIPLGEVLGKGGEKGASGKTGGAAASSATGPPAGESASVVSEQAQEMLRGMANRRRVQLRSLEDELSNKAGQAAEAIRSGDAVESDLKRSAQKDLQDAQTQFPSFSFSSLPSVGRTEGNEGNREQRRGI